MVNGYGRFTADDEWLTAVARQGERGRAKLGRAKLFPMTMRHERMQRARIEFKSKKSAVHQEWNQRGTGRRGRREIGRGELVDSMDGLSGRRFVALLPTNLFEMSFALAVVVERVTILAICAKMLCRATILTRRHRRRWLHLACGRRSTAMRNPGHREITRSSGSGEVANVCFQTFDELDDAFGRVEIGFLLFQ